MDGSVEVYVFIQYRIEVELIRLLQTDGAFPVPIEKLGALNESDDVDWRRVTPREPHSPTVGLLEGFHQIHCLVSQYEQ